MRKATEKFRLDNSKEGSESTAS
jgi:hypothetical protein